VATYDDFTVPVYDGRNNFSLNRYWARAYTDKVQVGATVMVLFTMKMAEPNEEMASFRLRNLKSVFLNALGVVVLAEPSDAFYLKEGPDPVAVHGVDRLPRLKDVDEYIEEVEDDDDPESDDVGETF